MAVFYFSSVKYGKMVRMFLLLVKNHIYPSFNIS